MTINDVKYLFICLLAIYVSSWCLSNILSICISLFCLFLSYLYISASALSDTFYMFLLSL